MPLARIIASNPAAARETVLALRQAGYKVEIVPPGTPQNSLVDLEFDADSDTVISQKTEDYVPGEREFFLKPLWRRLSAKYHADRDVARAQQAAPQAVAAESRAMAPAAPERREERAADEAATGAAAPPRHLEAEHARRAEELRLHRVLHEQEAARRAEEVCLRRVRAEQEAAKEREMEAQRLEKERLEGSHRQQELVRQREREQHQLALRQQEQEHQRAEAVRRAEETEAAHQRLLAREREERQRGEAQRQAEEDHRLLVMRQRQEEERERRAQALQMLIQANKQREESRARGRGLPVREELGAAVAVPTLRQYLGMRWAGWKQARVDRSAATNKKVAVIDRSSAFAWRQAWPITTVVAAAFLIGWGLAVYHVPSPSKSVIAQPPMLTPGQVAPYPVNHPAMHKAAGPSEKGPRRRAVRDTTLADDEVVTHHYYPSHAATAQNRPPQRKKISDLQ